LSFSRPEKCKKNNQFIKNPEDIIKEWPEDVINRLKTLKGKTRK
jgi:hypothetical protein